MPTPTKKQKELLDFVNSYIHKRGMSPTIGETAKRFKRAISTIHEHLEELAKKGLIKKNIGSARGIEIKEKAEMVKIPLLGVVSAGQPIENIVEKETLAFPKEKLPQTGNIFALKVAGDSMVDENINDGDYIIVKQQETAKNGQRVVALINNSETTLKKYFKEKNYIRLQPANKTMEPIIVEKDQEFSIQGIVIDVIENKEYLQPKKTLTAEKIKRDTKLPTNKIILGDAVRELKKLPSNSCDVVIIDPPYNIGKDFGNNIDKMELSEYVRWSKSWINESIRVMKPSGTMFIYGFSEILAYLSVEIPINKRWLIWHYTNKNMASLNFWQRSHEAIICAWKDKPTFNRDDVREPYTEGFLNGAAGKIRKGTIGRFSKGGKETVYKAHAGGALPRDVIKIPALAGGAGMVERWFLCKTCDDVFEPQRLKSHLKHDVIKHPTQKPLELTQKLIKSAMPKKDGVVLIPFVGSGSECVATKKLGLSYLGFELNPDYVNLAEKWLMNTKCIRPLF